nr:MAG TPA: Protein of unknown function (DUF3918) [Caudoviricetes sp.]
MRNHLTYCSHVSLIHAVNLITSYIAIGVGLYHIPL